MTKRLSFDQKCLIALGVYAVVGLLVYGWNWNRPDRCTKHELQCEIDRNFIPIFRGALWPGYLALEGAIKVTQPW